MYDIAVEYSLTLPSQGRFFPLRAIENTLKVATSCIGTADYNRPAPKHQSQHGDRQDHTLCPCAYFLYPTENA